MSSKSKAVIRIESDVNDAKNGIEQISKNLESLANRAKKNSLSDLAVGINAVTGVAKTAASAIKAVAATVNDLTATYKVQAKAETQLEAAARNNPYLSRTSVENLKKYAGELQSISIYGDEQLIPYMGELAAAGRTEKEIMDIMAASIDVAASGTMDLGAAVKALNGTYQGSAGTLSKNVKGVKELTQEQLKNGEAVKLVANQYKGMAEQTAKATGAAQQLKNAWGDFKEFLGSTLEGIIGPIQRGLAGLLGQVNGILAKQKEAAKYQEFMEGAADNPNQMSVEDLKTASKNASADLGRQTSLVYWMNQYQEAQKKLRELNTEFQYGQRSALRTDEIIRNEIQTWADISNQAVSFFPEISGSTALELDKAEQKLGELDETYRTIDANYQERARTERDNKRKADEEADKARQEQEQKLAQEESARKNKLIDDARASYTATVQAYIDEQKFHKQHNDGMAKSDEEYAKGLVSTMESAYFTIQKELGTLFDANGAWEKERMKELVKAITDWKALVPSAPELSAEDKKKLESLQKEIMGILEPDDPNKKMSQILAERIAMLEKYYKEVMQMQNLSDEQRRELARQYYLSLEKLDDQRKAAEADEEAQAKKNARDKMIADWQDRLSIAQEFAAKFSEIVSTLTDAALEASQAESKARLKQVETEYEQGLVSETEYEEKSKEIKKKAAEEEYRLRLWQWGAQIAQITIDTAQAVMSAMTQPGNPLVNIAMASLVGAMGAAQLGTAMAQKPQAPSFASGGIVPGNSWSGDRVSANVNSGEMVITRAQQADLWHMISGGMGQGGWNVAVNNYMGGRADVSARHTGNGLVLDIIDAHINQGMAGGTYDAGMAGYSVSQKGVTIL